MGKEGKIDKSELKREEMGEEPLEKEEIIKTELNNLLESIREEKRDKAQLPEIIAADLRFKQRIEIADFDKEAENFLKSQSFTEEEKTELSQFLDKIRRMLTTDKPAYIKHLKSIVEWKGAKEPRDKVMGVTQAHLNNVLCIIYDKIEHGEELDEEIFSELEEVAKNAEKHKITLEEYKQILDSTLKKTPEDKKDKVTKILEDLKTMIFEQEEKEEQKE